MDPNANLEAQERCLIAMSRLTDHDSAAYNELRAQLDELRDALMRWIIDGGYPPRWERWPVAAVHYNRKTR